mgnify:CR=1 FL=1
MNSEKTMICSSCKNCVRSPKGIYISEQGLICFHICRLDRPEYDFYNGECILYENKYECDAKMDLEEKHE